MKLDIWNNYRPKNINNSKPMLPIVIPYNPLSTRLVYEWKKLIYEHEQFKDYRIIAAFSRNKNLGELLAPRKPKIIVYTDEQAGVRKCNTKTCKTCAHITVTKQYTSTYTRRQYNIIRPYNCHTKNTIYLITCSLCNKQYVGETQRKLSERLTDHRSNVLTHKNTPIGIHFNLPGHSINNILITPIMDLPPSDLFTYRDNPTKLRLKLLELEANWQQRLMTYEPHGINLRSQ